MSVREITVRIDGMRCAHCERAVVEAVSGIRGVLSVEADAHEGVARIQVEEGETLDRAALASVIEEEGYSLSDQSG